MGQNNDQTLKAATSNIQQRVSDGVTRIAERAEQTTTEAKFATIEHVQNLRDSTQTGMTHQRDEFTAQLRRIGGVLKQSSEALAEKDALAARCADYATQRLERAANYVAQSDLRSAMRDTERFARDKPLVFLGGAFLVGLAAGRFLKSTSSKELPAQSAPLMAYGRG